MQSFWCVDPLAHQYYSISPYCYTANNPIRFIDPDGMQIGDGKDHFEKFKKSATDKANHYNKKAGKKSRQAAKARAKGKDKKAARKDRKAAKATASAAKYNETVNELNALESSDQVYNLYTNSSDVGAGAGGNIQYDPSTDAVNINIKGGYNEGAFAHELKHGYQFETGALSFGIGGKVGGALYDIQDEVEAYARGHLFGWSSNPSFKKIQFDYQSIKNRLSQRTLSTPASSITNSPTLGHQMWGQNKADSNVGSPPRHYYKDWKKGMQ